MWRKSSRSTLFVFTTWSTRSSTEQVRSCRPLPGVSFSSGLGADRLMDHVVLPLALPGGTVPVSFTACRQKTGRRKRGLGRLAAIDGGHDMQRSVL